MSFCTNCGTKLPDGTKFCTSCGTKVAIGVSQAPPQKPEVRPSDDGQGLVIDAPAGSTVEISTPQPPQEPAVTSAPETAGEFDGIVWDGADEPAAAPQPATPAPQPQPQPQWQQPQQPPQPQPQPQWQQPQQLPQQQWQPQQPPRPQQQFQQQKPVEDKKGFFHYLWMYIKIIAFVVIIVFIFVIIKEHLL